MNDKEIEELVDRLIILLPSVKYFTMGHEISKYLKSINSEIELNEEIITLVIDFMRENQYLEIRPAGFNEKLTQIGIDAKKAGGHFKYLNSLKPKKEYWLTKYQMIYLPLFFLFGIIGAYKVIFPKVSDSKFENLNSKFFKLKQDYDSLIKEYKAKPNFLVKDTLTK